MVAIKDMEMPKNCVTYTSKNDNYTACPFYKICEQRETIKTNYKPTDCPLVEIEPLTDSEQRIFLSAMSREERICKTLDSEKVDDSTVKKLVPIVNSIKRKVKKTLWD
jgi:hypothetical protein